jgi:hypothetical protein
VHARASHAQHARASLALTLAAIDACRACTPPTPAPAARTRARAHALAQTDALKFVTVFRSQLPQPTLLALLPPITALLGSESVVVHSYAATAIERFLALREGGQHK